MTHEAPIIIKKYANRRLYNTKTSLYITLDEVYKMVKEKVVFEVREAKTNEDITRHILMQIIVEQESKNEGRGLPLDFLKNLICMYESLLKMENMPDFMKEYFDMFIQTTSFYQKKIEEILPISSSAAHPINTISSLPYLSPEWWKELHVTQENLWKESFSLWNTSVQKEK